MPPLSWTLRHSPDPVGSADRLAAYSFGERPGLWVAPTWPPWAIRSPHRSDADVSDRRATQGAVQATVSATGPITAGQRAAELQELGQAAELDVASARRSPPARCWRKRTRPTSRRGRPGAGRARPAAGRPGQARRRARRPKQSPRRRPRSTRRRRRSTTPRSQPGRRRRPAPTRPSRSAQADVNSAQVTLARRRRRCSSTQAQADAALAGRPDHAQQRAAGLRRSAADVPRQLGPGPGRARPGPVAVQNAQKALDDAQRQPGRRAEVRRQANQADAVARSERAAER